MALHHIRHEIIVVDDNSRDGTWQWVEEVARRDPSLWLVRRMRDPDLSKAVMEGFRVARSDRFIVMDADGQHNPALLPAVVHSLETCELVVVSRYLPDGSSGSMTFQRRIASRVAKWLAQVLLDVPLSDPMAGFFGVRRETYAVVAQQMNPQGYKVLLELYVRLTNACRERALAVAELPSQFRNRLAGHSKVTLRIALQYLAMIIRLWRIAPQQRELTRFLCVGAMGTVVNFALLWILVSSVHWPYQLAGALAIELSVIHNFTWHDRWTFRVRRRNIPWPLRFGRYHLSTGAGLALNWLILVFLVERTHLHLLLANFCGIVSGTLLNFSLSTLWVWRRQRASGRKS